VCIFGEDLLPAEKKRKALKCRLCGETSDQKEWHRVKYVGRKGSGETVPDGRRCQQCWLAAARIEQILDLIRVLQKTTSHQTSYWTELRTGDNLKK
jgi:hypothetical protein